MLFVRVLYRRVSKIATTSLTEDALSGDPYSAVQLFTDLPNGGVRAPACRPLPRRYHPPPPEPIPDKGEDGVVELH